ncbi:MAG: nucleotidyltransferase domain-containing protein [archaeon]
MTTLLKPGIEAVMRIFYNNTSESFHLRELSRRAALHGQSIMRHLDFLEKNRFLQSRREGNQRRYSIRRSKPVYAIFTMFDVEKAEKLPQIRKQAIETYLKNLPKQPVFAVLFGSTAKENYTEESDIDILLVTNSKVDTKGAEKEADVLNSVKISTFQIAHGAFVSELKLKEDKVVQSAVHTGYPLINHISYYETLNYERI